MALTEQNMAGLVSISETLRVIVNRVGRASTWLLVPLVIITMWDVVARKLVWIQTGWLLTLDLSLSLL